MEQGDKIAFSLFGFGVASLIIGIVVWYDKKRRHGASTVHVVLPKTKSNHDYDAFLDEYESSNVHRGDSEMGENFSLSRSYSDFETVSSEQDESSEEDGIRGYNENDGQESYESDEEEEPVMYDSPEEVETASPLYSDPVVYN